jgi:hypothetical protein
LSLPVEKENPSVFTVRASEPKLNEINNLIKIEFANIFD